jgi:hypothetical protein
VVHSYNFRILSARIYAVVEGRPAPRQKKRLSSGTGITVRRALFGRLPLRYYSCLRSRYCSGTPKI